jgi:hypothetical protein
MIKRFTQEELKAAWRQMHQERLSEQDEANVVALRLKDLTELDVIAKAKLACVGRLNYVGGNHCDPVEYALAINLEPDDEIRLIADSLRIYLGADITIFEEDPNNGLPTFIGSWDVSAFSGLEYINQKVFPICCIPYVEDDEK